MIVNRGSLANKDYWIPDIDEQVLCLMMPNKSGLGLNEGFILGSFFRQRTHRRSEVLM
ncbi:hypothetical protein [Phascolarctobacterium faecium]|jgi:phage baseplate assembly protein gpV|uniref:hypothetical protein n=1 Tax=Phascolarctobacterium faecium TaxID=33025 RepID=UPI003AB192B7